MVNYRPYYVSMSKDVNVTYDYIQKRKNHELPSALTSFTQLNDTILEGIPWQNIFTIVGTSSSGKSTILESIKYDIIKNDPTVKCLSFEFDMLVRAQILRQVSKKTGLTAKQLKYVKGFEMTPEEEELMVQALHEIAAMPIWNVDKSISVESIKNDILYFVADQELIENNNKLLVTIDYVTLTKDVRGEDKKRVVDELYDTLVTLKKDFEHMGLNVLFICLSQTNRDIFSSERVKNPSLHYPTESDIFQSSTIFNNSDIVMFSINPSRIRGIEYYGQYKDPIKHMATGYPYLYWHFLKNRENECKHFKMVADFKHYRIYDA